MFTELTKRVQTACVKLWGARLYRYKKERALRVAEEALEYCQAVGVSQQMLDRVLARVYSRPAGSPVQEIAGILISLLAVLDVEDVSREGIALLVRGELKKLEAPELSQRLRDKNTDKARAGTSFYGDISMCDCPGAEAIRHGNSWTCQLCGRCNS